jgi:ABC-2 type transport system ATP-binding protein
VGPAALVGDAPEAIRVAGLKKSYRGRPAVRGMDLSVRSGEIYGLIGPDGAGKSTLLKAIAGVLRFDEGTLDVLGTRIDSDRAAERTKPRLGFLPQGLGLSLYPELSVEENIDFLARLRLVPKADLKERKGRLLAMTRLAPFRDRPMKHLSGGMKQKLGLICTLIHEPELVILDEPTTGVDPVSRRDFWAILARLLRERHATALVSTAYMDEASRFHRLSLVYGGRVVASGDPESIRAARPGSLVVIETERQAEAVARLRPRFPQVDPQGACVRLFAEGLDPARARAAALEALAGLAATVLEAGEADLEDVFVSLLREGAQAERTVPASPHAPPLRDVGRAAIEAIDLTRDFGSFRAVDHVSFAVPPGEIFGLLGANGAGKTTVIKMLTGILPPTGGRGQVAGHDMRHAAAAIKRRIGYVSQAFSLYQDLTVVENIRLYAAIYGLSRGEARDREAWVLGMGDLTGHEGDLAGSLPMGLRQRLALACALVHGPEVLFLDEPTAGVDPIGRRRFWELLFRLSREEGVAILVTTHYMSEAEQCDRLALLFAGRLVADATPKTLKREVEETEGVPIEMHVDRPLEALEALAARGHVDAALFGPHVRVLSRDPAADLKRIPAILEEAGVRVHLAESRTLSMEDVFVHRVRALEEKSGGAGER